ncbi:Putative transcriptional regulator%2C TetR family [Mycobacteroides abscessus]|nr:Putative transcriptional regulator%2C TetR family [Mycobacteroides abscessus]CQA12199.1 Putative transcriptional regulator%2C TetR family [Mycobacteroides abscessus]
MLGVNALLGKRATSAVFRGSARDIADEDYVAEWTALLAMRIESLR